MKKIIFIVCLLFIFSQALSADIFYATVSLDWMLSMRIGIEYRFLPILGFRTDIGASILGMLVGDVFFVFYLFPEQDNFQLNIMLGVPNAGMPFTFNTGMISLGASLAVGWRFSKFFSMHLHIGAGFPLFFEQGRDMIRDINYPLGLWPDLGLGFSLIL